MQVLYEKAPLLDRFLCKYRPYIVPFEELIKHVPLKGSMLDIGCGAGAFLLTAASSRLLNMGIGIEVSANKIKIARQAYEKSGLSSKSNINFKLAASFENWPNELFQCVSLIDVMHHIPVADQQLFFQHACQRVEEDGVLIYKDMCDKPFWRASANRLHDLVLANQWINYVPIELIESWANAEGLKMVERKNFTRYVYGHELIVFKRQP